MKFPRNITASVRQRLLNRAKSDRRPFNELLQYYAMEHSSTGCPNPLTPTDSFSKAL